MTPEDVLEEFRKAGVAIRAQPNARPHGLKCQWPDHLYSSDEHGGRYDAVNLGKLVATFEDFVAWERCNEWTAKVLTDVRERVALWGYGTRTPVWKLAKILHCHRNTVHKARTEGSKKISEWESNS